MIDTIGKIIGKLGKISARYLYKTDLLIPPDFIGVSFCFDDFPLSAAENAAPLLEAVGAYGTFYACFGLLGSDSPSGKLATKKDLLALAQRGHEIGCHTFDHLNCSFIGPSRLRASCEKNHAAAQADGLTLRHFAYPQGGMHAATKKIIRDLFETGRSITPGINRAQCDAHNLCAVPLYTTTDLSAIQQMITDVAINGGWLIIYTHDVVEAPSIYGITPTVFGSILATCRDKKIPIRTINQTIKILRMI